MRIHDMTWQEVEQIDFANTLVLIVTGATEQHGPHLPTDTDTLIADGIARELESRMPMQILLTPTMWLGYSPHHFSFGATLSVDLRVYVDMVKAVCSSYIRMGASRIAILNGHGGNHVPLAVVVQELKMERPEVIVASAEYWTIAKDEIASIRESGIGGLGHACELETSLYLYLDEVRVRKALIQDDGHAPVGLQERMDMFKGLPYTRAFNFSELTESGVHGQPSLASKEKGERFFQGIVGKLEQFVHELLH